VLAINGKMLFIHACTVSDCRLPALLVPQVRNAAIAQITVRRYNAKITRKPVRRVMGRHTLYYPGIECCQVEK
jgi:hypothetical protein